MAYLGDYYMQISSYFFLVKGNAKTTQMQAEKLRNANAVYYHFIDEIETQI